jgi:hypothetical protein
MDGGPKSIPSVHCARRPRRFTIRSVSQTQSAVNAITRAGTQLITRVFPFVRNALNLTEPVDSVSDSGRASLT